MPPAPRPRFDAARLPFQMPSDAAAPRCRDADACAAAA